MCNLCVCVNDITDLSQLVCVFINIHRSACVICVCVNDTGDVDGSLEAILDILETYNSPDCQLHLLNYGVGNITESDVEMAATFDGNVATSVNAMQELLSM